MSGRKKDDGLSEVIGFILIIAILVVIASLYVTYVVPAQGREAEIEHMTYIKNQFVDFKLALDSLWINQEDNISMSQNIEMGTLGQKTEGQFVFLPLTNPIGSDGEMSVSSDPAEGTIQVEIIGLTKRLSTEEINSGVSTNPDIYRIQNFDQLSKPDIVSNLIPVNIPNDLPFPNDFLLNSEMERELFTIEPNTSDSPYGDWEATVSLVRVPFFFVPSGNATDFNISKSPYYLKTEYRFDLVMNLIKNNETLQYPVFQNYTIASDVSRSEQYWINLQDPAYGLDIYGPVIVKLNFPDGTTQERRGGLENYSGIASSINQSLYIDLVQSTYSDGSITNKSTMGKFSYTGKNYYWIPQEYYYQMGGVFLVQNLTEGSVVKTLPLITLSTTSDKRPAISIINLHIYVDSQNSGFPSTVAGSTPVQIVSKVTKIRKGIISDEKGVPYFIAPGPENAKNVTITIESPDGTLSGETLQMWVNTFNSIIYEANRTSSYIPGSSPQPYINGNNVVFKINGPLTVDYTEVSATVVLQPVGWQGS